MQILYDFLIGISLLIGLVFSTIILVTGKGDAMGGGGAVRTTFKGKAGFDEIMSRWTLILGVSFMALMIVIDVIGTHLATGH